MRRLKRYLLPCSLLLLAFWIIGGTLPAMAIEEPDYRVLEETDAFEIRRYESFVIAEVEVEDDFKGAGSEAFSTLFRYIDGNNEGDRKIDMTAPVRQEPSVKIDMTAPVLQRSSARADRHRVSFVLPADFTLDNAPRPASPDVQLREVPERTMAVHRYSGTWSEKRFRKREAELLAALSAAGYEALGPSEWARYNGPFTPWFLRRNEIMVEVAPP